MNEWATNGGNPFANAKWDEAWKIATVDGEKWNALSEDRRREIGRHLAVYCGRVGGSDEYKVEIVDKNGLKLGSYERN